MFESIRARRRKSSLLAEVFTNGYDYVQDSPTLGLCGARRWTSVFRGCSWWRLRKFARDRALRLSDGDVGVNRPYSGKILLDARLP